MKSYFVSLLCWLAIADLGWARPVVRNIRSTHEFERLLHKHATETGLPVVVDFYSDSCGPCRMMAPIFKKVAGDYVDKAVFVKIDTNAQYELSARYQIRSLPTFAFFVQGHIVQQEMGGIGEGPLRQYTDSAIRQAEIENVVVTLEALQTYYQKVDPSKSPSDIQSVHQKCVEMTGKKGNTVCAGSTANQLIRKLRKKYGSMPKTVPRFTEQDRKKSSESDHSSDGTSKNKKTSSSSSSSNKPNLHLASLEELQAELEKRLDEARDAAVEQEDAEEDEVDPDFHRWTPSRYPERMVIIGGGPAGLAAALYGARAGLQPIVFAPSLGGQLQGKGVMVENYPGLFMDNTTGPGLVASMRRQAAHFGAFFEDDVVLGIDASTRPLRVKTNATGTIETHTIVVAVGAESNWLGVPGEWELRGAGVSSCATCDGFLFQQQDVVVVGGGDAAMEDALVLARTSRSVTVVHRRDQFRASKVLADRVLQHPSIKVRWNSVVQEIVGKELDSHAHQNQKQEDDESAVDLDRVLPKVVAGVVLKDVKTGEESRLDCNAVFIAIGHTPSTGFLKGVVDFDPSYPGYLKTAGGQSTQTSVPGIFAAGDVADPIYRQAITSAGSGAAAALDAERYLSEHGLGNEAADMEAELLAELMMDTTPDKAGSGEASYNVYDEAGGRRLHGVKESLVGGEL